MRARLAQSCSGFNNDGKENSRLQKHAGAFERATSGTGVRERCDSLTPHGFLENSAVGRITDWIGGILDTLKH
jgi:hypothetical protein